MQLRAAFFAGMLWCSLGCVHQESARACRIAVHSVADPYAHFTQAYVLLPLDRKVAPADRQFLEYSRYLQKALAARGYRQARSLRDAELVVFLGYGVGPAESAPARGPTSFTRYAVIHAVDAEEYRREQRQVRVWSTRIVSVGDSGDLRAMFPVILAGAWDLLGADSADVVRRRVQLNDADVLWLKTPPSLSSARNDERLEALLRQGRPN
jgi:hypothetical protein